MTRNPPRSAPRSGRALLFKAENVREVLVAPRISALPAVPPWILGACAHEGRAVSVVDLVALADGTPVNRDVAILVLVATPAGLIGIPVDATPKDQPVGVDSGNSTLVVDTATLPEQISLALIECGFSPQG